MRAVLCACVLAAAGPASAGDLGACTIAVEGAVTASGKSNGGPHEVGTDYWYKPDELEQAVKALHALGKTGPDADKAVAAAMQADPKNYALVFNCLAGDVRVSLLPGHGSRYADVPFGPKKYKVAKGSAGAGDFQALMSVQGKSYRVSEPGELDVTAFEPNRFAGTFQLKAKRIGGAEEIGVKGTFDYPCTLATKFCQEARAKK